MSLPSIDNTASSAERHNVAPPTIDDLRRVFLAKHGDPATTGWAPRTRWQSDYFTPDDWYEAWTDRLVTPRSRWLDVGGGRDVFPGNPELARVLAARAGCLVAVDPSSTVNENRFCTERHQTPIEQFVPEESFDLATLRMVAEHLTRPQQACAALGRLVRSGGHAMILTVYRWSPITLISKLTPHSLHHPVKKLFWRTEERDTFEVAYQLSTREQLRRQMADAGFSEAHFAYLADCRVLARFRTLNRLELAGWRACRRLGIGYPEVCLLGVYRRA